MPLRRPDHPIVVVAWVLDPHLPDPAARQRLQDEVDSLSEPGADDHLLRIDDRAANAAQIGGEHLPEGDRPARVAVVELGDRSAAAGFAQRPRPVAPGEAGQVRDAGPKVDRKARRGRCDPSYRDRRLRARGHARRGARDGPSGTPRPGAGRNTRAPVLATRRARSPARAMTGGVRRARAARGGSPRGAPAGAGPAVARAESGPSAAAAPAPNRSS